MDAKDLRVEPVLGERNDRIHNYAHGSATSHGQEKSKPFQEVCPTPISKVDIQAVRPCAVIGPDRVVPQPANATYLKKQEPDGWGYTDGYRKLPDYPLKIADHQLPSRNISPRQTFQESMPRVIVPSSVKLAEDSNNGFSEKSPSLNENIKYNMPSDPKYFDVPYIISPVGNDQRNARVPDVYASQSNSPLVRTPHAWPGPVGNPGLRPYGMSEVHRYPEYSNSSSRPMPTNHTLRQMHEGSMQHYPDPYPRNANIRYQPYPPNKELSQNTRYEYNNNQLNSYHPQLFPPQPSPQKYILQKSFAPNSYIPPYPHKYLDTRIPQEPHLDGYQRPPNNQPGFNLTYQGHSLLSNYAHSSGNCVPNKVYSYPEGGIKAPIKSTYENHNKIPIDYVPNPIKNYPIPDNLYNEIRPYPGKGHMMMHNYPSNMSQYPPPHYRKEYVPHFVEPSLNAMNPYSRMTPHFPQNMISLSDSNAHNDSFINSDSGYISLGSSASGRNVDNQVNKFHNPELLRRYDYRYAPFNRSSPITRQDVGVSRKGKSDKKGIDVRQFLQMWNEGDDEGSDNPVKDSNINIPDLKHVPTSQEELYVLGLVNVSNEELQKYEHIQKVSKLPENIKGYNSLELLDQFEEVIGAANVCSASPVIIKDKSELRNTSLTRPASPLDVEAKISQSVIHKDVGCNFEIKPCSPKMLNVEMAAPAISVIGERTIEKVSNPHTTQSSKRSNRDTMESFNTSKSSSEIDNIPSCKMVAPRTNDLETIKTDYTIHDLESNAGVCLASLPRLDADIEFNFPEVNQQFIDANRDTNNTLKMGDHSSPDLNYTTKTNNTIMPHSKEIENSSFKNDLGSVDLGSASASPLSTSSYESDKNHSKLSKFRRSKTPKEFDGNINIQCQRTNSVIIKNPENIERNSGYSNDEFKSENNFINPINMPVINKDEIITEKRSPIPMNLSYQDQLKRVCSDVILNAYEQSSPQDNFDESVKRQNDAINLTINDSSKVFVENTSSDNIKEYKNLNDEEINKNSPILTDFQENEHDINNFEDTLDLSDSMLDTITNLNCIDHKMDEEPVVTTGMQEISKDIAQDMTAGKDDIRASLETNETSNVFDDGIVKNDDVSSKKDVSLSFSSEVGDNAEDEKSETIKKPIKELNNINVGSEKDDMSFTLENSLDHINSETENVVSPDLHTTCNVKKMPSDVLIDAEASKSHNVEEAPLQTVADTELSKNNEYVEENNHKMDVLNGEHFENITNTYVTDPFDLDKICDSHNEAISIFNHDRRNKIEDFSNFMENLEDYKAIDDTSECNVKSFYSPKMGNDEEVLLSESTGRDVTEIVLNKKKDVKSLNIISSPKHNISDALSQIIDYDSDEYEFNSSNNSASKKIDSSIACKGRIGKELFSSRFQNLIIYEAGYYGTGSRVDKHESNMTGNDQTKTEFTEELSKICEAHITNISESPQTGHLEPDESLNISESSSPNVNTLSEDHSQVISNVKNAEKDEISPDDLKRIDYEDIDCKTFNDFNSNCNDNFKHEEFAITKDILLPDITDIIPNIAKDLEVNDFNCDAIEKPPRRILKRSFSDSSLCNQNNYFSHLNNNKSNIQNRFSWCKRKKINNQDECNSVQCNRRNSTSILQSEDVSFCILISDDCIIAEQDSELIVNDICETDNIQSIIVGDNVDNVLEINSNIIEDNTEIEEATDGFIFESSEDNVDVDVWVDDVACMETVVTDNVSEDSRSSEHSGLKENVSDCVDDLHLNDYVNNNTFESLPFNELEHNIYVSPIVSEVVETEMLYETSNDINVNDTSDSINLYDYGDSPEIILNNKDKDDLCKKIHHVNSVDLAKDLKESLHNVMNNFNVLPTVMKPTKTLREIFGEPDNEVKTDVAKIDDIYCQTQDATIHSCVASNMSPKTKRNISRTSSSSSPEVTSTTTEEKKSRIFLKITNYNGSRVSVVDNSHNKHQNHVTETTQFFDSKDRSVQPLITKAAKKYIPPLKDYHDFKVKLHLPCHKLLKLKELKSAKEQPKKREEGNSMRICRNEFNKITIKKVKPKFEDVLKSLDDIQYNLHKNKPKKNFKSAIPKVVIKKKENGSHYTSSPESEYNPDMSGRKWQPWVFLEKNNFIDNMVLSNKSKAVFCPVKNMYVLADKLRKYSHSEKDVQDPLKYAISLKPNV